MSIQLIAMDMDGTLLNQKQQISPENIAALQQAIALGVNIAICTGRSASDASFFASDAELPTCRIISLNGACCLDKPHGTPYDVRWMQPAAVEKIIEVFIRHQVTFACFQPERVIVIPNDGHVRKLEWGTHLARANANALLYGQEALMEYLSEGICKLVYIDQDNSPRIDAIRKELLPIEGLQVTASWSNNLELMPTGVEKGAALQALAVRLGLEREQVMAMGDYDNDLGMIQYAGLGVAMGNGSERVKKAAQYVTLTNEQHGVAEAIRKFVLS